MSRVGHTSEELPSRKEESATSCFRQRLKGRIDGFSGKSLSISDGPILCSVTK
jgi:hypothetical protein